MSNLSRRTLVASAAALPALTVPAVAAAATVSDNPDAELMRLGAKLDVVERDTAALIASCNKRWDEIQTEAERRTGIARSDAPDTSPVDDPNGYWGVVNQISNERNLDDEDKYGDTAWDRLQDRLHPITDAILTQRAITLGDLKIQARAVAIMASELWDNLPRENPHERLFIESACAFLGMDAKQIALGPPKPTTARGRQQACPVLRPRLEL
jgi:hypothetical protein